MRVTLGVLLVSVFLGAQEPGWTNYRDSQRGLAFSYPEAWGVPRTGTNDGFGNRAAAIRFSALQGLGGELALLRGRVTLDVQAFGGLYDPIVLEALPDALRVQVIASLPEVTPLNFCSLLGAPGHVPDDSVFPASVRAVIKGLDGTRNVAPRVVRCDVRDAVFVFDKEATFESPAVVARQHIFGAARFLPPPYSAVTLVRAMNSAPSDQDLITLARVVQSVVSR